MGLARPYLHFLVQEHKREPFRGSVLILGRQYVYATLDDALELMRREQVTAVPMTSAEARTNIGSWADTRYAGNMSDTAFFKLLGVNDVKAMDVSDYEGAEIVWDMNQPIPEKLHNKFDLVLDGGTLEHVFDVRQGLMNVANLVKPGGRLIHFSPMNNFANHGFFQFSPTLYFDYYKANNFQDLRGWVVQLPVNGWILYERKIFEMGSPQPQLMMDSHALENIFVARKTAESTANKVPCQAYYEQVFSNDTAAAGVSTSPRSWREKLKAQTSPAVKKFLIRYVRVTYPENRLPEWFKGLLLRFVPGLDRRREPWGLKRRGRLG